MISNLGLFFIMIRLIVKKIKMNINVNTICLKNVNAKLKSPRPKLCRMQPEIILQLAKITYGHKRIVTSVIS